MPQPIYAQQDTKLNGVFSSQKAMLNFTPSAVTGVLVQNLNFNFSQQVTRLYDLDSDGKSTNVYYVGGRTQGQMSIGRVVGPNAAITELYKEFGDVCKACDNTLNLQIMENSGTCCAQQGLKYILKFCTLTNIGISVQAQDMVFNEQSQVMFSGCEYERTGG